MIFFSFSDIFFISLLYSCVYLHLPLTGGNCIMERARLDLFLSYNCCLYFIIVMDSLICFGLRYSRLKQVLEVQHKVGFIGLCLLCAGMSEIRQIVCFKLFVFIYREGIYPSIYICGLRIHLHFGWSSRYLLHYWSGDPASRHKLLSQSKSARIEQSSLSVSNGM